MPDLSQTISLTVDVKNSTELYKAMEVLSRAAAGLQMDNIDSRLHCYTFDHEED